jgi:DNA-binding transcriptional regulator YiaG
MTESSKTYLAKKIKQLREKLGLSREKLLGWLIFSTTQLSTLKQVSRIIQL